MNDALAEAVLRTAGNVLDPEIKRPLRDLDMIREARVADGTATVTVALTISACPATERIERDVAAAAGAVSGITEVIVELVTMTSEERASLVEKLRRGRRQMPFTAGSLTRIILVSSGKGGVGKSTVTANLGVALARRGLSVGIIDADVHGYSIPAILGLPEGTTPTRLDDLYLPPVAHGVKAISIGMFLPPGTKAVAWRGPMLHKALEQFLTEVHFGDLDYLLIDMPPGTGDVAISLGQMLPHAEVIVVTTPQPAAADVAVRAGAIAHQLGQRVIGVVENMAGLQLDDGRVLEVFGSGGGADVATALGAVVGYPVPALVSVPFDMTLRMAGDAGDVPDPRDGVSTARAIGDLAAVVVAQRRGLGGRQLPLSVKPQLESTRAVPKDDLPA